MLGRCGEWSNRIRNVDMSISVIVPTLNEAACLAETLRSVRAEQPREILVVDGGSSDATCELAREADRILHGRADGRRR